MQRDHTSLTGAPGSNASSPNKKYLTPHTPGDRKPLEIKGEYKLGRNSMSSFISLLSNFLKPREAVVKFLKLLLIILQKIGTALKVNLPQEHFRHLQQPKPVCLLQQSDGATCAAFCTFAKWTFSLRFGKWCIY